MVLNLSHIVKKKKKTTTLFWCTYNDDNTKIKLNLSPHGSILTFVTKLTLIGPHIIYIEHLILFYFLFLPILFLNFDFKFKNNLI